MSENRNVLNQLNELNLIKNDNQILPERRRIISIIKLSQVVLFPDFYHYSDLSQEEAYIELEQALRYEIRTCLAFDHRNTAQVDELTDTFLLCLPEIKKKLLTDIQAIYDGDPAAKSKAEVLLCYPGFYATNIYRIAHELYRLSIPYIPRIMSEYAHEKTGIDINPGAMIDEYFCIDHGTGIVIGETATIGHHVKLYQGVTIGAKGFDLDENGNPLAGVQFTLKNSKGELVSTKTSGSDGYVTWDKLYPDIYTVTEIKTAAGKSLLAEDIEIKLPMRFTEEDIEKYNIDRSKLSEWDKEEKCYYLFDVTYEVSNDVTFTPPMTGAMITAKRFIPIACGMVVLMGATCIVFFKRKKKRS